MQYKYSYFSNDWHLNLGLKLGLKIFKFSTKMLIIQKLKILKICKQAKYSITL